MPAKSTRIELDVDAATILKQFASEHNITGARYLRAVREFICHMAATKPGRLKLKLRDAEEHYPARNTHLTATTIKLDSKSLPMQPQLKEEFPQLFRLMLLLLQTDNRFCNSFGTWAEKAKLLPPPALVYGEPVWILRGGFPAKKGEKRHQGCERKIKGKFLGIRGAQVFCELEQDDPLAFHEPLKKGEVGYWGDGAVTSRHRIG